ncbi:primary-amine oxidase [Nakamurella flavida]|uniref:Amine oxidase n=1 Tax=Nakamurella flavida TaxID=363630 RepID=A0A938YN65_9ACTN|nr:primary-amine oxidase [Nakamurella flavida]MBM9475981.1 primary-amine oxidase [Nakamurella flavida]MBM9478359.1 primary-amine oxidase [Nakamurella flavida]MDP9777730.1 primary-amine oxidase [Nakamurella flavida]
MAPHPLEPLTADEITASTAALTAAGHAGPSHRFASIALLEPPKADLLAWELAGRSGPAPARRSKSVLWDRADNRAYEAVVELGGARADGGAAVVSVDHVPGVTPNFTVDEWHDCETAMKADPTVVAALAQRGITDLDLVLIDVWTYGLALMPERYRDRRLGWADIWLRETPGSNPYAHLVPGLKLIVDMNTMTLLELDEQPGEIATQAPVMGEYMPGKVPGQELRTDIAPLHITQPDGVSFTLDGHELSWQNWRVRIGFTPREGLVLHQLRYDDHGTERQIAHRISFSEMVVPYRDSSFDHYRRTAYDIGEWGLGYMTTSLSLGCDCLGEIRYLDATLSDSAGEPFAIDNAICLHEEDNAVLWKHVDGLSGAEVRRMRRMVISCHATVANYEYLIYWRLYQDGNIECEVRATGIMVTTPIPEGAPTPATGTLVDQRTYAPFHQHFLVARLDLDIDGQANQVHEIDSVVPPIGPDNPYGLNLTTRATPIADESMAGRDYEWSTQRSWKVLNTGKRNVVGSPVAYKLVPTGSFPAMMDPAAPQYLRAPVIGHTLWVTRQHDDELFPCGDYPTQSEADDGMTRWVADGEDLLDQDVVLWYVFGLHHITRLEDWPVMPADTVSFWLKPFGFFDRNPSLDLPPSPGHGGGADAPSCHADPTAPLAAG